MLWPTDTSERERERESVRVCVCVCVCVCCGTGCWKTENCQSTQTDWLTGRQISHFSTTSSTTCTLSVIAQQPVLQHALSVLSTTRSATCPLSCLSTTSSTTHTLHTFIYPPSSAFYSITQQTFKISWVKYFHIKMHLLFAVPCIRRPQQDSVMPMRAPFLPT